MRQISVLIFSPEPSLGGGVAAFDMLLRKRLSANFKVEQFLIGRRPGRFGKTLRGLVPFYDAGRLAKRVIGHRHDVYHLNPSFDPRSIIRDGLFLLVLRIFRRQVLVMFRGWDMSFYDRIKRSRLLCSLFRATYGNVARILVLASRFKDDLQVLGFQPDKIYTFTTMFDGDLLQGITRRRKDDKIWTLFLARFVIEKGIYELLEAFRHVSRFNSKLNLIMAGDGPEAERAREWCTHHNIQRRVQFTGHVEGPKKAQLLVDSDIFVLPSYHGEGCPNALLEAMGAGLPVVVTPVGGILDIVTNGANGLVITPRNADAIAQALQYLAENANLRAEMSQTNFQEAWQKYEAKPVVTALENHYRTIHTGTNVLT